MTCSICNKAPADHFCICKGLPILCAGCTGGHEAKPGFHFPIQTVAYIYVQSNEQLCREWLFRLKECQENLGTGLQKAEQCAGDMEAAFGNIGKELEAMRTEQMAAYGKLKEKLAKCVEDAIKETTERPFQSPNDGLALLLYNHCCRRSSEPLNIFHYQVIQTEDCLKDCVAVTFSSPVPELASLNRDAADGYLRKEIADGKKREEDLQARLQQLTEQYETLQTELNFLKSRSTPMGYTASYPSTAQYNQTPYGSTQDPNRMSYQTGFQPPSGPSQVPFGGFYPSPSLPELPKPPLHPPTSFHMQHQPPVSGPQLPNMPQQPLYPPTAGQPQMPAAVPPRPDLAQMPTAAQPGWGLPSAPRPPLYGSAPGQPQMPAANPPRPDLTQAPTANQPGRGLPAAPRPPLYGSAPGQPQMPPAVPPRSDLAQMPSPAQPGRGLPAAPPIAGGLKPSPTEAAIKFRPF